MNRRIRRLAPWMLPLLCLSGCGGGGGGTASTGSIAGTMSVLAVDQTTLEAEPNDSASTSHRLGSLAIGDSRTVLGNITDSGSDPFDGFQIVVPQRAQIQVTLTATNGASDLDVLLVEPISLQIVDALDSTNASESGSFVIQGAAYLVIVSASGTSDYELAIEATALANPLPEVEPNDALTDAQYLGEFVGGNTLTMSGATGGGDTGDYLLLGFSEAGTLNLNLTLPIGEDFDIEVSDVTSGLGSPVVLDTFDADSTGTGEEIGSLTIPAMTLVAVKVYPFAASSGTWSLVLSRPASVVAQGYLADLSVRPRASAALEQRFLKNPHQVQAFTATPTPFVSGEVVLRRPAGLAEAAMALRGSRVAASNASGLERVEFRIPSGLDEEQTKRYTAAMVATLAGVDGVAYAEPNYLYQPSMWSPAVLPPPMVETRPNDNFYNLQWHYEALNLPLAWDLQTGSPSIITAILDTGSTPAPDLDGREIQGIDMISSATIAGDGNGIDNDPFDVGDGVGPNPSSYHGSHVAGTVGAETNNGQGVAGVTWAGGVMHVRVLGIGGGTNFDIANGILYAGRQANSSGQLPAQRAHVINMSLGGPGYSQAMQDAVTATRNAGTVIIAAAGNENSSTPSYPAAYDGVISVAAVGYDLTRAPYSNFHPTVDVAAPGGNVAVDLNGDGYGDGVLSTKPDDSVSPINYASYSFYQGTSMAAPHVAGVAALIRSENPSLTVAQVEAILTSTATDLGAVGKDNLYGYGLVNAFAAVQAAGGGGGGAPVLALGESTVLLNAAPSGSSVCRTVSVTNGGGGMLQVTGATPTTQSGGAWLTATPVASSGSTSTDTSAIQVCVDPSGLADGTYRGDVALTSNGGSVGLAVVVDVGNATAQTNYVVYVLAVDIEQYDTVAQAVVQTQSSLAYSFPNLAEGSYYVVAGTDEDNDGFICDEGEPLCGLYPSLELPAVIEVQGGMAITDRNFPLQTVFSTASVGQRGFRLLPSPAMQNATSQGQSR
ncbi:MAG TPA: S8 family peptidase [Planctomycetota bacterium]|nr:S8 family peptidase [Planctomycetota bacterium]